MKLLRRAGVLLAILFLVFGIWFRVTACVRVDDPSLFPAFDAATALPPPQKPLTPPDPERSLFFGDLHIHTALSADAYTFGVRAMPDDAYVFARGGTIEHGAGYAIRLDRPLDFAAVTDHSETIGIVRASQPDLPLTRRPLRDLLLNGTRLEIQLAWTRSVAALGNLFSRPEGKTDLIRAAWNTVIDAAERHNRPGEFTTFIGYEWSSGKNRGHLHRNVIYRDDKAPDLPFSAADSADPEDLWAALAEQSTRGMRAMAIPHNANLSNGSAYEPNTFEGEELDSDYAERRNRWERVSEILQVKGASETHPVLSTEDEFANFEIHHMRLGFSTESEAEETAVLKGSYARAALRQGLEFASQEGFNPFRFGVIGSSDSHNASSTPNENAHHGKLPMLDGSAAIRLGEALLIPNRYAPALQWGSGGLAAVWAEENTRGSLFDALDRRETYATSGPRIRLRFFGGWSLSDDILDAPDPVARCYASGVPMGGDLPARADAEASPKFAVWAAMDPDGAHLDRIQIVKGWVDAAGESHERIYDVAASDNRVASEATQRVEPLASTVDVATASYANRVGATQLARVWRDPDFDASAEAFYYARVLEITTPRWSTYDAVRLGVAPPEPSTLQERAVSSAIWYAPN